ncbi:MAG TPA: HD domain-containing protein [Caldilineaceae bacterium]|nr:HD domain-containing protein [Caldilineaceae bacterium]
MQHARLAQQITFLLEVEKLKGILRATKPVGLERRENSAEHSWHIALCAILLAEHANQPVDLLHVVKMLLIHDIVEIDAGDTPAFGLVDAALQHANEQRAADRLFNLLPADQAAELMALWHEFEQRSSAEAKFAHAVDRLLPPLQNYYGAGGTWVEYQATLDRVLRRMQPVADGSTTLWDFVQRLLDDAVAQGLIAPTAG